MNSRERITLHAEHAGWFNTSEKILRDDWGVDLWRLTSPRMIMRISFDRMGRVRNASVSDYKVVRTFRGLKLAQQIIEYILEEEKKANGGVRV